MPRITRSLAWAIALLLGGPGPAPTQDRAVPYAPAAVQNGARLYRATCAACHGPSGDLIPGVDLKSGRFRRASSEEELARLVTTGIPGTAMPPSKLDPREVADLVAFVRSMRDFE